MPRMARRAPRPHGHIYARFPMRWWRRRAGTSDQDRGDSNRSLASRCCAFEIMAFLVFGTAGVLADRYSPRRKHQQQTFGDAIFTFIFVGLAYAFCAAVGKQIFQSTTRRRSALRLARLRRRFPISGKWPDRGWLVMLRARDRRALAKSPRRRVPLALCCRHFRRARPTLRSTVVVSDAASRSTAVVSNAAVAREGDEALEEGDVERCEDGGSGLEFTRTVVRVVEIEEEGLFRNIVSYL
eukprot:g18858.t1